MTQFGPRVEIYERPTYTGGSGPPMAPITLLPEHDDRSWIITQLINFPKVPHYVVHPKDAPVVRKAVRKDKILDWVSPRALEAFEFAESLKRDTEDEEKEKITDHQKLTKNGKKRGRPFKTPHTGAGPPVAESIETETDTAEAINGQLARSVQLEKPSIQQPSLSQPSLSLPSLSLQNLSLKRKMESLFDNQDAETTEEESARSVGMEPPARKRSRADICEGGTSKTPINLKEPLSNNQTVQNPAVTFIKHKRSKSLAELSSAPHHKPQSSEIQTPQRSTAPPCPVSSYTSVTNSDQRVLRDRSSQPFYGIQRTRASRSTSAVYTASPTRTRLPTAPARYPTKSGSITSKASPTPSIHKPTSRPAKPGSTKRASTAPQNRSTRSPLPVSKPVLVRSRAAKRDNDDGDDGDRQWAVIKLLKDKWRMRKKRKCHYYLVKWAGDYEPTWERAAGITEDLKEDYEAEKKRQRAMKLNKVPVKEDMALVVVDDRVAPSNDDDPIAKTSNQVGNGSGGLFLSSEDDSGDGDDMANRQLTGIPTSIKREESDEDLDEWQTRSPYFPQHHASESDEGDYKGERVPASNLEVIIKG